MDRRKYIYIYLFGNYDDDICRNVIIVFINDQQPFWITKKWRENKRM